MTGGRTAPALLLAAALLALLPACATYSERLAEARRAVEGGRPEAAIEELNAFLGVDSRDELPDDDDSSVALGLLERGTLLHAVGDFGSSARDWREADERLEVLDLTRDPVGTLSTYLYSESAKLYRLFPSEQLALNTLGMLNELARGDLAAARVEARRFTVTRRYLESVAPDRARSPLGSYLAGFVFEHLGEAGEALRYYDEALSERRLPSLGPSLARLARRDAYRGRHIERALQDGASPPPEGSGDLLVVVGLGRVPHKVPERMPVGAAIGLAGAYVTGNLAILERSALKVVVYPALVASGNRARDASVRVAGRRVATEPAADFASAVRSEYEDLKPQVIGAALSRLVARAAVAEGTRAGVREASGSGPLGLLAALLVEGTLVGLDKPDTRSWTFLPGQVLVARQHVPAGEHEVLVDVEGVPGGTHRIPVTVAPGGFAVVSLADLR